MTAKGWVAASQERHYYNLDLDREQALTLEDILGEDYVRICNESIDAQIREQVRTDEMKSYFGYGPDGEQDDEMGIEGFTTVSKDTKFYLNEEGNPVIVFDEYEIAPGYMGTDIQACLYMSVPIYPGIGQTPTANRSCKAADSSCMAELLRTTKNRPRQGSVFQ